MGFLFFYQRNSWVQRWS